MPYAKVNDINMYYEIHGEGEPLVFINGAGVTLETFYPQIPSYLDDFQLILYDHRNTGKSSSSEELITMELLADDLAILLDAISIESTHVRGTSMGGMVAQHFVLQYPEKVRSLVLTCTTCQVGTFTKAVPPPPEFLEMCDIEKTKKMTPEEFGQRITDLVMTQEFAENNPEIHKQTVEMFEKDAREFAYNLSQQTKMFHDTYERLSEIEVPTFVIAGNADKIIPFENSEIIASRIPGAELVVIEGAGHTFIEAREEETKKTLDFLKRQIY